MFCCHVTDIFYDMDYCSESPDEDFFEDCMETFGDVCRDECKTLSQLYSPEYQSDGGNPGKDVGVERETESGEQVCLREELR